MPDAERAATAALVTKARAARYQQESALAGYVTMARQRWSAGIGLAALGGLGPLGRPRLAARFESVARMSWDHERGAWAELIASRAVAPIVGEVEPSEADDDIVFVLPFHPGRDRLWPMSELAGAWDAAADWISHPLANGSDSLYRFRRGGALHLTLPDGARIELRELEVRPVRPSGALIVGSLWLDAASGALVRAAYRPSVPVDLWPYMEGNFDQGDREMFEKFGPYRGNVEEIVIEHGLYAGRFWLPRVRIAHAEGTAKGGRITISIEQTFDYESVRALPPGVVQAPQPPITERDPQRTSGYTYTPSEGWQTRSDPDRSCRARPDSTPARLANDSIPLIDDLVTRYADDVPLRVLFPCRRAALLASPALPPSIYSPSEELFTEQDLGRLRQEVGEALAMSRQAEWSPQPATVHFGFDRGLLRYNRVEALSAGVRVERELGRGYRLEALARLGVADLEPNGEVSLRRSSGRGDRRIAAFRRLDASNDWGNPLGVPASLGALLLGRDDGLYYRALGVELGGTSYRVSGGPVLTWRVFGESHTGATVETDFSLANAVGRAPFDDNILADEGNYAGAQLALAFAVGANPLGTQFSGTAKGEGAGGAAEYGRGSLEVRLATGLGGSTVAALTAAAGGSLGELPVQRRWYLGGPQTLHAHGAGTVSGEAFWFGRAELARGFPLIRPMLFGDVGWAGARGAWATSARRYWAAGIGAAALDGLVRVDLSRALDDSKRWSLDLFIEIR